MSSEGAYAPSPPLVSGREMVLVCDEHPEDVEPVVETSDQGAKRMDLL